MAAAPDNPSVALWRHLALCQCLHAEQPAHVWISHMGVPVTRCPPEGHFLRVGAAVPILRESIYHRLLGGFAASDTPLTPGTAALALSVLGQAEADFLFCETEAEYLMALRLIAPKLGVEPSRLRLVHGDGLGALDTVVGATPPADLAETLAFVDPADPLDAGPSGTHGLALFCRLATAGVQTLLAYRFDTEAVQAAWHRALAASLAAASLDPVTHNLWIGELRLIRATPEAGGAGLLAANLSTSSLTRCADLGQALADLYARTVLPDGRPGDLHFTHAAFGSDAASGAR